MLDLVDNEAVVLAVLGDRYRLPVDRLAPGRDAVAETTDPRMPVRALVRGRRLLLGVGRVPLFSRWRRDAWRLV